MTSCWSGIGYGGCTKKPAPYSGGWLVRSGGGEDAGRLGRGDRHGIVQGDEAGQEPRRSIGLKDDLVANLGVCDCKRERVGTVGDRGIGSGTVYVRSGDASSEDVGATVRDDCVSGSGGWRTFDDEHESRTEERSGESRCESGGRATVEEEGLPGVFCGKRGSGGKFLIDLKRSAGGKLESGGTSGDELKRIATGDETGREHGALLGWMLPGPNVAMVLLSSTFYGVAYLTIWRARGKNGADSC